MARRTRRIWRLGIGKTGYHHRRPFVVAVVRPAVLVEDAVDFVKFIVGKPGQHRSRSERCRLRRSRNVIGVTGVTRISRVADAVRCSAYGFGNAVTTRLSIQLSRFLSNTQSSAVIELIIHNH